MRSGRGAPLALALLLAPAAAPAYVLPPSAVVAKVAERRAALQVGARREVGFLAAVVGEWIGLDPLEPPEEAAAGCGGGRCGPTGDAPVRLGRR